VLFHAEIAEHKAAPPLSPCRASDADAVDPCRSSATVAGSVGAGVARGGVMQMQSTRREEWGNSSPERPHCCSLTAPPPTVAPTRVPTV